MMKTLFGVLVLSLVPACPPSPAPTLTTSGCESACKNVHDNLPACPEGQLSDCVDVCSKMLQDKGMPRPNLVCLTNAKSTDDVKACGWNCMTGQEKEPSPVTPTVRHRSVVQNQEVLPR